MRLNALYTFVYEIIITIIEVIHLFANEDLNSTNHVVPTGSNNIIKS